MDSGTALDAAREFADRTVTLFHPKEIVLFGSQVQGNATEDSDIDIAVVYDSFDDKRLERAFQLYKLRRSIDTRIEPILVQRNNDPSSFYNHIKETGKVLYQE
ncbi:MAG: nucleotidyltransferase domain-containing protein [Bacteroidetes bacterium]|nr:nucleotidyltransferase domain-containing protein [Bacteroidota bacterium]